MSACIDVPFWPVSLDNLRWSQDNMIAVAGSDSVVVLVPKIKTAWATESRWQKVIFKVNTFSTKELQPLSSLCFRDWSLGEELSLRYVLHLDWSPPGLGSFGSCGLAILHSDHVMDIWEYCDRPDSRMTWKRCLVVTTTIREYYFRNGSEKHQIQSRIRGFAWAAQSMGSCTSDDSFQDGQLLAVSTEAGDILILEVQSPYDVMVSAEQQWRASVLHKISCAEYMPSLDHARAHDMIVKYDYHAMENLLWIDRKSNDQMLAFVAGGAVHILHFTLPGRSVNGIETTGSTLESTLHALTPERATVDGPLCISPDGQSLYFFIGDALVSYSLDQLHSREAEFEQHIERKWSEISGLAVIVDAARSVKLLPATHLAYERLRPASVSFSQHTASKPLAMQNALSKDIRAYAEKYRLGAGADTRTWGIAAAPTGAYTAICSTMLPSDSVAHVIQSDQSCQVYLCERAQPGKTVLLPHVEHRFPTSIESVIFALQDRISDISDPITQEDAVRTTLKRALSNIYSQYAAGLSTSNTTSPTAYLRQHVFGLLERYDDMEQRLTAYMFKRPYSKLLPTAWYLNLIHGTFRVSDRLPKGQLSQRILQLYEIVEARLSQPSNSATEAYSSSTVDRCGICHEGLKFEALKWAACSSGHRFNRCALTFLAISRPGTSKVCGICGAQYLNEQRLEEFGITRITSMDTTDIDETISDAPLLEPASSLARLLFASADRCILCSGRFMA